MSSYLQLFEIDVTEGVVFFVSVSQAPYVTEDDLKLEIAPFCLHLLSAATIGMA